MKNHLFFKYICLVIITIWACFFSARSFSETKKNTVYVYQDEGVSKESLQQTIHTLKAILPPEFKLKAIHAKGVIKQHWMKKAALFVMPGGADLPYMKQLNGKGNQRIKNYVQNGGAYLGICAGAYYAASHVEFDKGGPLEVIGNRELAFFKGKMIGPTLKPYHYQDNRGASAAIMTRNIKPPETLAIYHNGGGYFEQAETHPNTTIIAYYNNHLPAIVSIKYGQGRVVLSGVHIEYDAALLNKKDPYLSAALIDTLNASNQKRLALLDHILKYLM